MKMTYTMAHTSGFSLDIGVVIKKKRVGFNGYH